MLLIILSHGGELICSWWTQLKVLIVHYFYFCTGVKVRGVIIVHRWLKWAQMCSNSLKWPQNGSRQPWNGWRQKMVWGSCKTVQNGDKMPWNGHKMKGYKMSQNREMVGNGSETRQNGSDTIGKGVECSVVYFFMLSWGLSAMTEIGNVC